MESNLMLRLRLALAAVSTSVALLGGVLQLFASAAAPLVRVASPRCAGGQAQAASGPCLRATAKLAENRAVHGPPVQQ